MQNESERDSSVKPSQELTESELDEIFTLVMLEAKAWVEANGGYTGKPAVPDPFGLEWSWLDECDDSTDC